MEGNSIIIIVLALCLSASMAALFVCAVRLSRERRKTSIFYGISKDLETDPMRCGGRMEEVFAQELRGIAEGLAECSAWSAHCCGRAWTMLSSLLWRSGCRHFRRK